MLQIQASEWRLTATEKVYAISLYLLYWYFSTSPCPVLLLQFFSFHISIQQLERETDSLYHMVMQADRQARAKPGESNKQTSHLTEEHEQGEGGQTFDSAQGERRSLLLAFEVPIANRFQALAWENMGELRIAPWNWEGLMTLTKSSWGPESWPMSQKKGEGS